MTDLLNQLATLLKAEYRQQPTSQEGYHATCPKCGKPAKRGQKHFFFRERGFKCWVCGDGWHGSLKTLADFVGLDTGDYVAPDYHEERVKVESSVFSYRLVGGYEQHPRRVEYWQDHTYQKPCKTAISEDLIFKYHLGIGRLPDKDGKLMKTERLVIPAIRGGKLVMLRGRDLTNRHPIKWQTVGSPARLINGDLITSSSIVVVMENWIDALLAMILLPDVTPVATSGGASTWLDGWSKHIASVKPKGIILAMDNDEAGAKGNINVANSLLKAGYKGKVKFHEYDKSTPEKASLVDTLGVNL